MERFAGVGLKSLFLNRRVMQVQCSEVAVCLAPFQGPDTYVGSIESQKERPLSGLNLYESFDIFCTVFLNWKRCIGAYWSIFL